jgi:P27 family predicted phage terminase small subunit
MGKRGPKPTPTAVLKLRQSWRGNQRGPDAKLDQKRPACPKRFIAKAKTEDGEVVRLVAKRTWDRLAPQLFDAGLLVDSYREPFECLCDSYARFVLACSKCDETPDGMVTATDKGNLQQNPWITIRKQMWEQVQKGAASFGLTPADLASVRSVQTKTDDAGKGKFFKGVG